MSLQQFVCTASQIYLLYPGCVVRNGIVDVSAIIGTQQPVSGSTLFSKEQTSPRWIEGSVILEGLAHYFNSEPISTATFLFTHTLYPSMKVANGYEVTWSPNVTNQSMKIYLYIANSQHS